ncbi:hypothetical protein HF319_15560, partial [Xanthomonas sp. Kuri4-1]
MGTGVLALALGQWPGSAPKLALLGEWLCLANSAVFVAFCAMYAARWLLFFDEARRIFGHATMSMFLGTLPMALATLINGLLRFGLPRWGAAAVLPLAEALWWLDVAMALACGVAIPWLMFTRQRHRLEQMTAVWLLPIVAAEVAATSGGLLAPHLADATAGLTVLVTSYVLWAYSVPVALSLLGILLLRLALHRLPPAPLAAQTPVLMLTARDSLDNKLAGFDSGADDYLIKPFALQEVEVRLNALSRRGKGVHTV